MDWLKKVLTSPWARTTKGNREYLLVMKQKRKAQEVLAKVLETPELFKVGEAGFEPATPWSRAAPGERRRDSRGTHPL